MGEAVMEWALPVAMGVFFVGGLCIIFVGDEVRKVVQARVQEALADYRSKMQERIDAAYRRGRLDAIAEVEREAVQSERVTYRDAARKVRGSCCVDCGRRCIHCACESTGALVEPRSSTGEDDPYSCRRGPDHDHRTEVDRREAGANDVTRDGVSRGRGTSRHSAPVGARWRRR